MISTRFCLKIAHVVTSVLKIKFINSVFQYKFVKIIVTGLLINLIDWRVQLVENLHHFLVLFKLINLKLN